ncbi:hypothetical protein BvCmsB16680_02797 [Escherichia coli]|nr:hypothetical protein BvCmsB5655_01884 [Escherichia coli]GCK01503.1 hypothetical protein BvCmsB16680_02797 [Escherichia coli]
MILSGLSLWEKGSPLHKSTQQVRTQGPIRHADCRQRKLADFLCTGGIIQGLISEAHQASCANVGCGVNALSDLQTLKLRNYRFIGWRKIIGIKTD